MKIKDEYFSKKQTDCLKAVFAFFVILSHIWAKIALDFNINNFFIHNLGRVFSIMGYISVSIFLFLSGYGLFYQYKTKGTSYIEKFPKRNILSLYVINICMILFYSLFYCCQGKIFSFNEYLQSFLFGNTIIPFGWYLQVAVLFYILFWISFKFTKSDKHKVSLLTALIIIYCVLCHFVFEISSTWYECSLCFVLGILFCMYKEKIDFFASKCNYIFAYALALTLFAVLCFLGSSLETDVKIVLKVASTLAFCVVVVLTAMKTNLNNVLLSFFGSIYLEMYVLQGFSIKLFRSEVLYISNPYLYVLAVLVITVILAKLSHPLFNRITRIFK